MSLVFYEKSHRYKLDGHWVTGVALKPLRSGWCGLGCPPGSHERCSGWVGAHWCKCACHVIDAEILDGPVSVDVEVGSPEWYEARRTGVTASEIPGLLGISPEAWSSPFNLYWEKKLGVGGERDTNAMQWGHDLEAAILRRFAREHPELHVTEGGLYYWSGRPWQMATPDGLASERPGGDFLAVVQAKTDGSRDGWGAEGTDQIPAYYLAQVRYEMDVMGVGVGFVPVLFSGRDYREYVVDQNTDDVALMRSEALAFLARLERDDPPEVDWRTATLRTLKALHPDVDDVEVEVDPAWVEAYRRAAADEKDAKVRKREAENHLRDQLGRAARGAVDGTKVVSRSVYDMAERTLPACTVNRITVSKEKETP